MYSPTSHGKSSRVKGIISDSNNISFYDMSEDMNKKSYFQNFQLILILGLQVMHEYVHCSAPQTTVLN